MLVQLGLHNSCSLPLNLLKPIKGFMQSDVPWKPLVKNGGDQLPDHILQLNSMVTTPPPPPHPLGYEDQKYPRWCFWEEDSAEGEWKELNYTKPVFIINPLLRLEFILPFFKRFPLISYPPPPKKKLTLAELMHHLWYIILLYQVIHNLQHLQTNGNRSPQRGED